MVRVLHVISGIDPQNGGSTAAVFGLAKAQVEAGLNVALAATWRYPSGLSNAPTFENVGVRIKMIGPAWGALSWHPQIARELTRMLRAVDVVHVHGVFEEIQYQAMRLACREHKPYVLTPTNALTDAACSHRSFKKRLYIRLRLRQFLQRASCVHTASEQERDGMAWLKLKPAIVVRPNGVDLKEFEELPPPGTFIARYPTLRNRPIVLFVGRLSPEKGLPLLLNAFRRAIESLHGSASTAATLVIAGPDSGGYQSHLTTLSRQLGLADRVFFTGMLKGRARIEAMVDAAFLVLPSLTENFGLVVIESLAAGTPVILTEGVGLRKSVCSAGVGAAVPYDVDRLGDQIARWLSSPDTRAAFAANARPFALSQYGWETIAKEWRDHYSLLARSGVRNAPRKGETAWRTSL